MSLPNAVISSSTALTPYRPNTPVLGIIGLARISPQSLERLGVGGKVLSACELTGHLGCSRLFLGFSSCLKSQPPAENASGTRHIVCKIMKLLHLHKNIQKHWD
jgi:hypothetical protein